MTTPKKIFTILSFISFAFFILFLAAPKTLAGSYPVSLGCVTRSPGPCDTSVASIDMTSVIGVTYDSDNFDDYGYAMVTGPSGATQRHNSSYCCFGHIPTGNITSWFTFDGVGVYTIYLHAADVMCCDVGAWANLTVTTIDPPTCTLSASPASINIGDSTTLSWTTTNIVIPPDTAAISDGGGYNYTVTSASGSTSVTPSSPATYTMTVTNTAGTATCTASVSFNAPSCTLSSSDSSVWRGDTVTLSWTTTNATAADINGVNAAPVASGSMTSPPINSPTAFTMTATGPGGTGTCGPVTVGLFAPPIGGLVPCGRLADDPSTLFIDETKPCDLCAVFYMLKKSLNFAMEIAVGIAVFILVIAGLLYAFSSGNPRNIEIAKSAVTYALLGLFIIFIAWLIIAIILNAMGYAGIAIWNQVNCSLQT